LIALAAALLISVPSFAASLTQTHGEGLDAEMSAMAEAFPGFGGFYYDEAGRPNVYLRNLAGASIFQQMDPEVVIHKADFDFRALQQWRLRLRSGLFAVPGVISLDVDETSNRIKIGVAAGASLERVAREVSFHLVPDQAVIFEAADPIIPMASLLDQIRPVPGGVQINFPGFLCTLGFNASRGGVAGFVTNSHCTSTQGGVESTPYFQPLSPASIGVEIADPEYARCPRGKLCRESDSSFAQYNSASLSGGNSIARTTSRGQFNGSLTIDDANPSFTVTGTGSAGVGTEVNKVGRTTGWTFGPVTDTCVDTSVQGSRVLLLCQTFVEGGVGGGDSGSPVFTWSGGNNATLVGLLWGGNGAGTLFVFSPYSAVAAELGLD
jgi:hypothetical protein